MALEHAESGNIVDLAPLGASLKGQFTRAIVKTEEFQVITLVVHAGERIPEHKVQGPITLHCLTGEIILHLHDKTLNLKANEWVYLDGGVLHAVSADIDSAALLTIIFPGD